MPVKSVNNSALGYWYNRTETANDMLKRLVRNIRCAKRHQRVFSEYNRLNDPIISKAYATMSTAPLNPLNAHPCSDGSKRQLFS